MYPYSHTEDTITRVSTGKYRTDLYSLGKVGSSKPQRRVPLLHCPRCEQLTRLVLELAKVGIDLLVRAAIDFKVGNESTAGALEGKGDAVEAPVAVRPHSVLAESKRIELVRRFDSL